MTKNYISYNFSQVRWQETLKTDIDTDENVFTTLTPELINYMIAEFTEKHKEDIILLLLQNRALPLLW